MRYDMSLRRFNHLAAHPGAIGKRQPELEADDLFLSIYLWADKFLLILD
jgi:hypothetical protein